MVEHGELRALLLEAKERAEDSTVVGIGRPQNANAVWTLLDAVDWIVALEAVLDLADETERRVRANRKALEQNTFVVYDLPGPDDYRAAIASALGVNDDHAQ